MATMTIRGRAYPVKELATEVVGLARQLAENARLLDPLPADTDFSDAEDKEVQTQIQAVLILPPQLVTSWWLAFSAHHLPALAACLCAQNPATQPKSVSTLVQILSLLPEPKENPYLRRFLFTLSYPSLPSASATATATAATPTSAKAAATLPNAVAGAFYAGIQWRRPSGPGSICSLLATLVHSCPPSLGSDGKACIDAPLRRSLTRKLGLLEACAASSELEETQRLEVQRLHGLLQALEALPGASYVESTRAYAARDADGGDCGRVDCEEDATQRCTRCKSVAYCGKGCQTWHWKNGHRLECFIAAF